MEDDHRCEPLDDLVAGVRRGDRDAIAAVYLELAPGLRGFLRRRVPHGEVADDLVEQTFVELIEAGGRFRGDGRALRAWLYRAARNNLADWGKRAERRSDHVLSPRREAEIRDDGPDLDERVVASQMDPVLTVALAQLTADQREVLELRLIAQLSITQVAEIIDRTVGSVKLLQHRAVRRLRALLGEDEVPGSDTSDPASARTPSSTDP